MIKGYLQYIKENSESNSNIFKDLEKIPSLDIIIDDVFVNFMEDNDLKLVTKIDGITVPYENTNSVIIKYEKKKSIFKNIYWFNGDSIPILEYDYDYSYGYRVCFVKNNKDYILTKENISHLNRILNSLHHNLNFISNDRCNFNFIVGPPITFTDKEVLDYYGIHDYKQDSKGVYIEVLASYVANLVLHNICIYKKYFTSTDDIWENYDRNDVNVEDYLNIENINIIRKLDDEDIESEINYLINYSLMDAYIEEFLEDIWGDFLNKLKNNLNLKVELVKGKYYPYTHDDMKVEELTKLKIYYVNDFITDTEYLENHMKNEKLSTIVDNYFNECESFSLSPIFGGGYSLNYTKLNKEVADILQKI